MPRLKSVAWILACVLGLPAAIGTAADLEQMTKDLTLLQEKYYQADSARRAELSKTLRQLIHDRSIAMRALAPKEPARVFRATVSQALHDALPAELQPDVERLVDIEGTLKNHRLGPARFPYQLRDQRGRTLDLYCAGEPPTVVEGSTVRIHGVELGAMLVFEGGPRGGLISLARAGSRDAKPPKVAIASPGSGAVVRGTVRVSVDASDDQRIAQVSLVKDGVQFIARETAPYDFTWDTTRDADGPHTLAAKAHDAGFNAAASGPVAILVDNAAPRASLTAPVHGASISGTVTIQAQVTDAIGVESVKFLIDGASAAVAVSPPYAYAWDTTAGANGRHALQVAATDRAGNTTDSSAIEVRVLNRNAAPALNPIGAKTVGEAVALNFTVTAADPDGDRDSLRLSVSGLPPWAAFDPITRQVRGTPGFTEASHEQPARVYSGVRFEACDAQPLCDSEEITITVTNANRPPVMQPMGPQTIREGELVTFRPVVTDPDGDPLTCTGLNLPPWTRVHESTCAITGRPGTTETSQVRPDRVHSDIVVRACDPSQACTEQPLVLTIVDARQRPALERIGDKQVDEGKPLQVFIRATDPDHELLELTATPLPPGATFVDEGTGHGTLLWKPGLDQAGTYDITMKAFDGSLEDTEIVTITVREVSLTISGVVEDEFHKPFQGATIALSRPGDHVREAITDAKGRYLATALPPGTYTLKPEYRYDPSRPTPYGYHFSPLSRRVELGTFDHRDIDFQAVEN